MRILRAVVVLSLCIAPSSALRAQRAAKPCSVDSASFARFAGTAVRRDCDVDKPAKLRRAVAPRIKAPAGMTCLEATLEFVVDSVGHPDTTSAIIYESNSEAYAAALLATLSRWTYTPAEVQRHKVAQVVRERRAQAVSLGPRVHTVGSGTPPPGAVAAGSERGIGAARAPCR